MAPDRSLAVDRTFGVSHLRRRETGDQNAALGRSDGGGPCRAFTGSRGLVPGQARRSISVSAWRAGRGRPARQRRRPGGRGGARWASRPSLRTGRSTCSAASASAWPAPRCRSTGSVGVAAWRRSARGSVGRTDPGGGGSARRSGSVRATPIVVVLVRLIDVDGVLTVVAGKHGVRRDAEVAGRVGQDVARGDLDARIGARATGLTGDAPAQRGRSRRSRRHGCGRSRRRRSGWHPAPQACCRSPASSRSRPRRRRRQCRRQEARSRPARRWPGRPGVARAERGTRVGPRTLREIIDTTPEMRYAVG